MVFSEREGLKLDAIHKYCIISQSNSKITIERDWMKTSQGKIDFIRNGNNSAVLINSLIQCYYRYKLCHCNLQLQQLYYQDMFQQVQTDSDGPGDS